MGRAEPFAIAVWLGGLALGPSATAEGVKLKNGQSVAGEILRYDDRGVELRFANSKNLIKAYATDEIEALDAPLGKEHAEALDLLARDQFGPAGEKFVAAFKGEERAWVKGWIRIDLVRALRGAGKYAPAGELFLEIAADREDNEVMALAPLAWRPGEVVGDAATKLAHRWLADDKRALAQLLAASWLLEGEETAAASARAALDKLQTSGEQRVGWMARAQLWRERRRGATAEEIARLRDLIEKMPPILRGGPRYVLGLAYEAAGHPTEAALAFLWVPLVHEPRSNLAADALVRAGKASAQAGFAEDARKLFREIQKTYPGTDHAAQADRELEVLKEAIP